MIRTQWKPATDQQRRAAADVEDRFKALDRDETEAWKALAEARDLGVPLTHLVERSGRPRPTVYRKLDELGFGNPANRTWTLTITGDFTIADLRRIMTEEGVTGKPVKTAHGVALSLVGDEGKEQLQYFADQLSANYPIKIS